MWKFGYLNDIQDNKSELRRTMKELRSEIRKVKENKEGLLKSREELNYILLSNIHNDEKEKNKEYELKLPKIAPYKRKGRKMGFSRHKTNFYFILV